MLGYNYLIFRRKNGEYKVKEKKLRIQIKKKWRRKIKYFQSKLR